eukprot:1321477-Amorphochlora_amoeboformis.AAC.1
MGDVEPWTLGDLIEDEYQHFTRNLGIVSKRKYLRRDPTTCEDECIATMVACTLRIYEVPDQECERKKGGRGRPREGAEEDSDPEGIRETPQKESSRDRKKREGSTKKEKTYPGREITTRVHEQSKG